MPAPRIIVEESVRELVPGARDAVSKLDAVREALRLLQSGERALIAARGAWGLWRVAAREAWMRGDNYFLLEAADPVEAELAGVGYGQLVVARAAYAGQLPSDRAVFEKLPLREKRVTRRALLAGAVVGATMAAVEKPVETSMCSQRGVGKACSRCLEECRGRACAAALCSVELLQVPGYGRDALRDYLRVLGARGPGYLVWAPRWLLHRLLPLLREPQHRPVAPVYIVPVGCSYTVGLEEALAARALGLHPLVVAEDTEETGLDPYCGPSRGKWLETVAADYEELAGERLYAQSLEEAAERLAATPALKPLPDAAALLNRGLHVLAASEQRRLLGEDPERWVPLRTPYQARITVDPERCTLCSACVQECPTNAIELNRSPDREELLYTPARCIACRHCADICPEDAIRYEDAAAARPAARRTLVAEEAVRCIACGAPIASRQLVEKVLKQMLSHGFPRDALLTVLLCDSCKPKYQFGLIKPDWEKIPSWARRYIERAPSGPMPGRRRGAAEKR